MSAVQPCDAASSPVSSYFFGLNQPTTCPPPLVQMVLLASSANIRWCVLKQVSIRVSCPLCGSYMASCRLELSIGYICVEGWSDPARHQSAVSAGRMREVIHTCPRSSNMALCTLFLLVQMISSPQ